MKFPKADVKLIKTLEDEYSAVYHNPSSCCNICVILRKKQI